MTRMLVVCGLLILSGCSQIPWRPDLGGALRQASRTNRLVVVSYWSAFDSQCQEMERDVFSLQEVQDSLAETIPVRIASWADRKFAESYGITKVPSFVVLGPDGRVLRILQGYVSEGRFRGMVEAAKLNQ
ncbi:MAG: hypothetical protein DHS20C16_29430 [Phycisphaerae bacterium]|nr:MAG: hypothetical protein DHS20C16_29430 [Phycisphaerae bacterium]